MWGEVGVLEGGGRSGIGGVWEERVWGELVVCGRSD